MKSKVVFSDRLFWVPLRRLNFVRTQKKTLSCDKIVHFCFIFIYWPKKSKLHLRMRCRGNAKKTSQGWRRCLWSKKLNLIKENLLNFKSRIDPKIKSSTISTNRNFHPRNFVFILMPQQLRILSFVVVISLLK